MSNTLSSTREECYLSIAKYIKDKSPEEALEIVIKMYPPQLIDKRINNGQEWICRKAECLYGEAQGNVKACSPTKKTYWIWLFEKVISLLAVYWNEEGKDEVRLKPKFQKWLDEKYGDWETSSKTMHFNTPEFYCHIYQQYGAGTGHSIKLYPRPKIDGILKIYYTRLPNVVANNTDVISLEGVWYDALIDYVTYKTVGNAQDMQNLLLTLEDIKKELLTRVDDSEEFIKIEKIGGVVWRDK